MFKRVVLFLFGIMFILVVLPIILYLIIITPSSIGIIRAQDSGAWLGFYGSIIGGTMTLLGVWWTIKEQDKLRKTDLVLQEEQRKNDIRDLEIRRVEDRRASIAPFLSYVVDNTLEVEKEIPSSLLITPKGFSKVGTIGIDLTTQIIVQNIGLGVAINPHLLEIFYDHNTIKLGHRTNIYLNTNDKAAIPLPFILPKLNNLSTMKIKLGYFNILQDFYEQTLLVDFIVLPSIILDENNVPIRQEYTCEEIKIINVERPILSDALKYRGLKVKMVIPNDKE